MNSSARGPALDRRALLQSAILLVGGSIAGLPANALAQAAGGKRFFSAAEYGVLTDYLETLIPRTDTPGAKDAGVPEALDSLMRNWASAQHQAQFRALVQEMGAAGLVSTPAAGKLDLVRRIDAQKIAAQDPTYAKLKELALTLYYLSEAGATKELRYELIPGKWEPWTEMAPDARAWAI